MSNLIPANIEDVIDQIISDTALPIKLAKSAFSSYMRGRESVARGILLKRISEGKIDPFEAANQDELIGTIYVYIQCAQKGLAQANLDLLAQAIAGEMKRDKIYPDKFHKYVNVLSLLTRDEIFFLGRYLEIYNRLELEAKKNKTEFFNVVTNNTWHECTQALVPNHFQSVQHMEIVVYRLLGIGFVHPAGAVLGGGIGVPNFTILLHEIAEIVDFEQSFTRYPEY